MTRKSYCMALSTLLALTACTSNFRPEYPATKRTNVCDTLWGVAVPDPYRWLENDTSAATAEWVRAENEITNKYLEQIPFREGLRKRLSEVTRYATESIPLKKHGKFYFYRNDGTQNQSVLYEADSLGATPRVVLDPNTLSKDGTVALSQIAISPDGKYLAYSIARSGSDWNEIYVMDLKSGELLPDHIKWIKFSNISWYGNGFYYCAFKPEKGKELSATNTYHTVYYHQLGSDVATDKKVYCNEENPYRYASTVVTDDKHYLIIFESAGTSGVAIYVQDLTRPQSPITRIIEGYDNEYSMVGVQDGRLLLITNHNAPNYRLVSVDPRHPDPKAWQEIIPECNHVISNIVMGNGQLLVTYTEDVMSHLYVYTTDGKKQYEVELPRIGSVNNISAEKDEPEVFYSFTSFTYPETIFRLDTNKNQSTLYFAPETDFNSANYESKQVFYQSKDGTQIPMTVTYKKGIKLDGNNPTLLYGYGGFTISLNPRFNNTLIPFLEQGGIYAEANLRGGGEYGEEWHIAGTKMQKQNVFDDFIAAAEYLIKEGYTSSQRLAIYGGSNGGLLVGACMTQHPELYAVAIPAVGVMDMLRYHKFTIGWGWAGDYGTADDSVEMFKYLLGYSPLHNMKPGTTYPATLVMTADHDDRVVPAHSFKFAAELQYCNDGTHPTLIRIDSNAGHGAGRPRHKIIDEKTDMYSFIMYNLGMNPHFE